MTMSNGSSTPSPEGTPPTTGTSTATSTGTPPTGGSSPPPPAAPPKPGLWRRIKRILFYWVAGVLLAVLLWTVFAYHWNYSEGDRGGVLQKFSKKGWLCKTYEGELALYVVPGMAPEIWEFSVRDEAVAAQLSSFVGERVQLHYAEHRGLPTSCFGETAYFVDRVTPSPSPTPPVLPDATAPAAQTPMASPQTPMASPQTP
jgi:hypothetical protein